MQITNELVPESFLWENIEVPLTMRIDELSDLEKVVEYCRGLNEKVYCDDSIYSEAVEEDATLEELLYGLKKAENTDGIQFLRELFLKKITWGEIPQDNPILCSCGEYEAAAANLKDYARLRQSYLKTLNKPQEYADFMRSCFPNSVFSDECDRELGYIKDFKENVGEITDCISLLDEKAVELFLQYSKTPEAAMKILEQELGRTCAPDPKHQKQLSFEFSYDEKIGEEIEERKKKVVCHPHFKLIRDDSNLRVYFQWKDDKVGNSEKVLIGRIGRHPWKK